MGHGMSQMKREKGTRHLLKVVMFSLLFVVTLPLSSSAVDLEGDGTADLTVYRPLLGAVQGTWYVASSRDSFTLSYQWGLNGDFPVGGGYTGGTGDDLGVWRPTDGVWYLRHYDASLAFASASAYQWGLPGDTPSPCDFNGDGRNELTVFRGSNGTWYRRNSTSALDTFSSATIQQWGLLGDTPIAADYDGDGSCDYAIFRNGSWFIIPSSLGGASATTEAWGLSGDVPVPADYDGDGALDLAVYRERAAGGPTWYIKKSSGGSILGATRALHWGLAGDLPVVADFTGDGRVDIAVWRPSSGVWLVLTSESNFATPLAFQFGLSVDIPHGDSRGTDPETAVN